MLALLFGLLLAAPTAFAETAWIRGEVRLNMRTGPGTEYRILRNLRTGDRVEVLERKGTWTQVRSSEGAGWIPAGFLMDERPPTLRLEKAERELSLLRARMEEADRELETLRDTAAGYSEQEQQRETTIQQLTRENLELKEGALWPYLITGASILAAGLILGTLARGFSERRQRGRIRF